MLHFPQFFPPQYLNIGLSIIHSSLTVGLYKFSLKTSLKIHKIIGADFNPHVVKIAWPYNHTELNLLSDRRLQEILKSISSEHPCFLSVYIPLRTET